MVLGFCRDVQLWICRDTTSSVECVALSENRYSSSVTPGVWSYKLPSMFFFGIRTIS